MKGLSPLIAEVLLIAFVITVGTIIATWVTSYSRTTVKKVNKQSNIELTCSYGSISFSTQPLCNETTETISGFVKNNGNVDLGNIRLQIIYKNSSFSVFNLTDALSPGEIYSFNVSVDCSSLSMIRVITNCTQPEVSDELSSDEITFSS